jgi:hypothetical protein
MAAATNVSAFSFAELLSYEVSEEYVCPLLMSILHFQSLKTSKFNQSLGKRTQNVGTLIL